MAKWISVEDSLPKQKWTVVFVFWIDNRAYTGVGFYDENLRCFMKGSERMDNWPVTHWLKLPKIPRIGVFPDLRPYIRMDYR